MQRNTLHAFHIERAAPSGSTSVANARAAITIASESGDRRPRSDIIQNTIATMPPIDTSTARQARRIQRCARASLPESG